MDEIGFILVYLLVIIMAVLWGLTRYYKMRNNNIFSEKLYKECISKGLTDINTKSDKDTFVVIANNLLNNVSNSIDPNFAVRLFYVGRRRTRVETQKALEGTLLEQREKEKNAVEEEKKVSQHIGRNKYIRDALNSIDFMRSYDSIARHDATCRPIRHNPNINAAASAAIGGVSAGYASYVNTVIENEKAEARAKQVRENGLHMQLNRNVMSEHVNERKAKEYVEQFKNKLVDAVNKEEKFKNLLFENIRYEILSSKNVMVKGKVKAINDSFIINKPAVLDGSLTVTIKSQKGKVMGIGYYNAPGYNRHTLDGSGFSKNYMEFSALCYIDLYKDYINIDTAKINIDISPNNMWLIEK